MNEEVIKKCQEADIDPAVLTEDEIEALKREIEAEKSGRVVLDGVLSNPSLLFRKIAQ